MLLIEEGRIVNPLAKTEVVADLLLKDGKIIKIGNNLRNTIPQGSEIERISAADCYVLPGLVDGHVHFRDPGFTYKEDIDSGSGAALKGGVTTVVLMANTKPVVDNTETLEYVLEKGKNTKIHVESCGAITKGLKGKELVPMEVLKKAGARGFTDDGIPLLDENMVRCAMREAKRLNVPLSFHEENPAYIVNNGINAGKVSEYFHISGSDRRAEISMVERDLKIALETGASVNIQHISTREAVELVRKAKKQGGNIHAEATPHHFTLTEEAVIQYGTMAKMNPPLREEEDRLAIIEGLKDGTIDLIATDHAPHSREEKSRPFTEAPSGIIGLETELSLSYEELVLKAGMSMAEVSEKMSLNPARMYHLNAGYLAENGPADLCIFNPCRTWVPEKFASRSQNSPFLGRELRGVVEYTIVDGKIQYKRN